VCFDLHSIIDKSTSTTMPSTTNQPHLPIFFHLRSFLAPSRHLERTVYFVLLVYFRPSIVSIPVPFHPAQLSFITSILRIRILYIHVHVHIRWWQPYLLHSGGHPYIYPLAMRRERKAPPPDRPNLHAEITHPLISVFFFTLSIYLICPICPARVFLIFNRVLFVRYIHMCRGKVK